MGRKVGGWHNGWGGRLGAGTMGDARVQQARSARSTAPTQNTTATWSSQPLRASSRAKNSGPTLTASSVNSNQMRRPESQNRGTTRSRRLSLSGGMQITQQPKLTDWFNSAEAERERALMDRALYGGSTQSTQATGRG